MQLPAPESYLCAAAGGSGAAFSVFAVFDLSGIRGRWGLLVLSVLVCLAGEAWAQRPPLLRELTLRTDTTDYRLSRNTVLVQDEPHLYFYYHQEDETAELLVYPAARTGRALRLQRSADFTLLDSLTPIDGGQYYRAKLRFKDLSGNRFLSLTFRQPSDSASFAPQTQTVKLLPVTRTTLRMRRTLRHSELYYGDDGPGEFDLSSNCPSTTSC